MTPMSNRRATAHMLTTGLLTSLLMSCGSSADFATQSEPTSTVESADAYGAGGAAPPPAAAPKEEAARMKSSPKRTGADAAEGIGYISDGMAEMEEEPSPDDAAPGKKGGEDGAPTTRSWFPETFLFAPLVVTDASGQAQVTVTVPDRLTTWRVLALAHDRQGHQAGDVTAFQGTLPIYVEPVVPAFLVAGDRVRLPLSVVNTTSTAWSGQLDVDLGGAATGGFSGAVNVPAGASRVVAVPVAVTRAGAVTFTARLGDADAVVRTVEVRPAGQKLEQIRGGTLASPRNIELEGARDMDPSSARVRVIVHPGALSVLRRELARTEAGGGNPASDAYTLQLSGTAPALLSALGETVDDALAKDLRKLGLIAAQRALRHARAPDTATAMLLAPAAAAHPDNPVMSRLATRLADQLAREQRPDGTFMGGGGATVQRMLVATAQGTAAVAAVAAAMPDDEAAQHRATRVQLAASAAFERHEAQIRDPYTAAAVLASGAASPALATALRVMVREGTSTQSDGSRVLTIGAQVQRSDGRAPSTIEGTALAALALLDDPEAKAILPDLGAALLGAWRPGSGWGDGRTDLLCSRAVTTLLGDPLPDNIDIIVERDGTELVRGQLSGDKRTQLLVLEADGAQAKGLHTWTVRAEPAVPGLGFSLALQTWVPWPEPPPGVGVETQVTVPGNLRVGRRASLGLAIAAPARTALELRQPLPAGVQLDDASVEALVAAGKVTSWSSEDGLLTLSLPAQDATSWTASVDVVPTLAGAVQADATRVTLTSRPELLFANPGSTWQIAP